MIYPEDSQSLGTLAKVTDSEGAVSHSVSEDEIRGERLLV